MKRVIYTTIALLSILATVLLPVSGSAAQLRGTSPELPAGDEGGRGLRQILAARPALTLPDAIAAALAWLDAHQEGAGTWAGAEPGLRHRNTAAALLAYAGEPHRPAAEDAAGWLRGQLPINTDLLARSVAALAATGRYDDLQTEELLARQKPDGSWGATPNSYQGNPFDTALALLALDLLPDADPDVELAGIVYLLSSQRSGGGWALTPDRSSVQATATVLLALSAYQYRYNVAPAMNAATQYLVGQQKVDGSFGDGTLGTPEETALATMALWAAGTTDSAGLLDARSYLLGSQGSDGSWNGEVYATALAARALAAIYATRVSGTVRSASSGRPIAGATVRLIPPQGETLQLQTSADGRFDFTSVRGGVHTLVAERSSYAGAQRVVLPRFGHTTDAGALNLTPMGTSVSIVADPLVPEECQTVYLYAMTEPETMTITEYLWETSDGRSVHSSCGGWCGISGNRWSTSFSDDGVYVITATVRDDRGHLSQATTALTVTNKPPTVGSSIYDETIYVDEQARFYGRMVDCTDDTAVLTGRWDFGDGESYSGYRNYNEYIYLKRSYDAPGVYTTTFRATDKDGATSVVTKAVTVLIPPSLVPTATFSLTPTAPLPEGSIVDFTDASTTPPDTELRSWRWYFGDGTRTGVHSPPHYFADDGVFDVTLTVTNTAQESSAMVVPFTITNLAPEIALPNPLTVSLGLPITFTASAGDPSPVDETTLSYAWDFGDGGTSTSSSPVHTWSTSGPHTLQLTVQDKDGASDAQSVTVNVVENAPRADFTGELVAEYDSSSHEYTSESEAVTGTLTSWTWYFDGQRCDASPCTEGYWAGRHYARVNYYDESIEIGLHSLRLVVTDDAGRQSAVEKIIRVAPRTPGQWEGRERLAALGVAVAPFTTTGSVPYWVIEWDDGTYNQNGFGTTTSHAFTHLRRYEPVAFGASYDGIYMEARAAITTITPLTPTVGFEIKPGGFNSTCPQLPPPEGGTCYYDPRDLTYTRDGSGVRRVTWSWGDGTPDYVETSLSQRSHAYEESGTYTITLTMQTSMGLSTTIRSSVWVTNVAPSASSEISRTAWAGEETQVIGVGEDVSPIDFRDLRYHWDFGDGNQDEVVPTPPGYAETQHIWANPGTYTVTLTVSDPDGGSDTAETPFTVIKNDPPVITSQPPELAIVGEPYTYPVVAYDPEGGPLTYTIGPAPAGMTISTDGVVTWHPDPNQTGFRTAIVKVSDDLERTTSHYLGIRVYETPPGPDLVPWDVGAGGLTVDPQTLVAGGSVSVTLRNVSPISAAQTFSVTFFEDTDRDGAWTPGVDTHLGEVLVPGGLGADAETTVSAQVSGALLFRDNLVHAFVDSSNVIDEAGGEQNNVRSSVAGRRITAPPGPFDAVLEWVWKRSPIEPALSESSRPHSTLVSLPHVAPLIDTNGDGAIDDGDVPAIIFVRWSRNAFGPGMIHAVRGDTGEDIFIQTNTNDRLSENGFNWTELAIGDLEGDGVPEIVGMSNGYTCFSDGTCRPSFLGVVAYANDGTIKWSTRLSRIAMKIAGAPTLVDLDHDGTLEIVYANFVLNSDGSLRWEGPADLGVGDSGWTCCSTTVADLDMDGSPEIVAGNTAYRADSSIYWDRTSELSDGRVSIANFDDDPYPELVVTTNLSPDKHTIRLQEHDGSLIWKTINPCAVNTKGGGGPPVLLDVTGDDVPDIGVAGPHCYAMIDGSSHEILWSYGHGLVNDSSNTGSTAFDFDGDGIYEILHQDQAFLRVHRATDGALLWQYLNPLATIMDHPVVADVDKDGHAEIVVGRSLYFNLSEQYGIEEAGIFVFGDRYNRWQPARNVWTPYNYHVTNVEDDGDYPIYEEPSWLHNNTYRVQAVPEGADPYAASDLTASRLLADGSACPASLDLTLRVGNGGSGPASAGAVVAFYRESISPTHLITTATLPQVLQPGEFVDVTARWENPTGDPLTVIAVVDADTGSGERETELDELNNVHQYTITPCDPTNNPPAFTSTPDTTAYEGVPYIYNATASDPDGDTLTYALRQGPSGAAVVPATGQLTWLPDVGDQNAFAFELRVYDGRGGVATQSFTITVVPPDPPAPPPICTIPGGDPGAVEIPGNGIDDDCNPDTPDDVPTDLLQATLATDKRAYAVHENVHLLGEVTHPGTASTFAGLDAVLTVYDTVGAPLFTGEHPLAPLPPGQQQSVSDIFATGSALPGLYTADLELFAGSTVVARASTAFTITDDLTAALAGTLDASPDSLPTGSPFTATWSARNVGSVSLNDVALTILVVEPASGQVIGTAYAEETTLNTGQILTRTVQITGTWNSGPTLLVLYGSRAGTGETLASDGITFVGDVPPSNLTIDGPTYLIVGAPGTFTATVAPFTVNLPVTYTWEAEGQPTEVRSGTLTDTITYTWPTAGTYAIAVTADNGVDAIAATHTVTVTELYADFTGAPLSGTAPLTVTFTNQSQGSYTACRWDFGDGASATTCGDPAHTYTSAGSYTVTLAITGTTGSDVRTRRSYVTITSPAAPPQADFTAAPLAGAPPLTVVFTDTSTGAIDSWLWDFGDGSTSSHANPSHTYLQTGVYTVTLTVSGPGGQDTQRYDNYVHVSTDPIVASFTGRPTEGAAPLTVAFTDSSAGPVARWLWAFGDGLTSTVQHPTHIYSATGTYTVTLTVSDAAGSQDYRLQRPSYVHVTQGLGKNIYLPLVLRE